MLFDVFFGRWFEWIYFCDLCFLKIFSIFPSLFSIRPSLTSYIYSGIAWKFRPKHYLVDGLNSLRYKLVEVEPRPLYFWMLVALPPHPSYFKRSQRSIRVTSGTKPIVVLTSIECVTLAAAAFVWHSLILRWLLNVFIITVCGRFVMIGGTDFIFGGCSLMVRQFEIPLRLYAGFVWRRFDVWQIFKFLWVKFLLVTFLSNIFRSKIFMDKIFEYNFY